MLDKACEKKTAKELFDHRRTGKTACGRLEGRRRAPREAKTAALGLVLFGAPVSASAHRLRRHHFGPAEWLWRSFTYGAWQPPRR